MNSFLSDSKVWSRRDFAKVSAAATLGLVFSRLPAMAGPFTREDFDHLVPADKKLSPDWVKSLFARGEPEVLRGNELKYVAETNAPGIGAYRASLEKFLANQPVQALPHERIISRLDEAGKTFKVLIIKTPFTKPHTSVFFQLECAYWNAEFEKEMRAAIK